MAWRELVALQKWFGSRGLETRPSNSHFSYMLVAGANAVLIFFALFFAVGVVIVGRYFVASLPSAADAVLDRLGVSDATQERIWAAFLALVGLGVLFPLGTAFSALLGV